VPTGGVTAVGGSFGAGLLGGATGGVTATNYSNPFQFNSFFSAATLAGSPIDTLFFLAKQAACK